jgi:hypothetical protein
VPRSRKWIGRTGRYWCHGRKRQGKRKVTNKEAADYWATLTPDEQIAATRRGYSPFAKDSKKGKRARDRQDKKGDAYSSGKVVSSGFEQNRRKH